MKENLRAAGVIAFCTPMVMFLIGQIGIEATLIGMFIGHYLTVLSNGLQQKK